MSESYLITQKSLDNLNELKSRINSKEEKTKEDILFLRVMEHITLGLEKLSDYNGSDRK